MWKDTAARRGLAVLALTLVILSIDLIFGFQSAARADEPKAQLTRPVASLIVTECDKGVGFIITDDKGNITPVPLEGKNLDFVNSVLTTVPEGHRLQATLPCKQGTET